MTNETRSWLNSQHPWIQEAALRLLTNNTTTPKDISDFVALIKANPQSKGAPKVYPSFGVGSASATQLRLVSIGDITGIDNLAPRVPLNFGTGNLVVIFGSNGSGKSGYARILKKACGKAGAKPLRPNVYLPIPSEQKCTITFSENGIIIPSQPWIANSAAIPQLTSIDIFDTASGKVYIDGENEVSYKPAEIELFANLVNLCKIVEAALNSEQAQLKKVLPELPAQFATTTVASIYNKIQHNIIPIDLSALTEWTATDDHKLSELKVKLQTSDPLAVAKQRRVVKKQVDLIKSDIEQALLAVSPKSVNELRVLVQNAATARQASNESALAMTASSQLNGVGSETWRALWTAARAYSTTEAYPEISHPNIADGARCVLCHQELDPIAKQRLTDFESYIKGKLEADAIDAESNLATAIKKLPTLPNQATLDTAILAAEFDEETSELLKSTWTSTITIADELRKDSLNEIPYNPGVAEHPLLVKLSTLSISLEEKAQSLEKDATTFDRTKAVLDVNELEAKLWTSQQATAINAEIARLKAFEEIEQWKKATKTAAISTKASALSESLITESYVRRFNDELKALNASHLSVELVKSGAKLGQVKHRIQLKGFKIAANVNEILSEGENRIVALAAFMADVLDKPAHAPFVFDDPISSLDHEYEWHVAVRLAELAKTRQVIVLTHRLSLYGYCEDAAKKIGEKEKWMKQHYIPMCIEHFSGTAGHPIEKGQVLSSTAEANDLLCTRLNKAKKDWDTGESVEYKVRAQSICSDFRKLVERTIEDDLMNKVVLRHRRSVTTDNRISHLAKISKIDCQYFDGLMTKYSFFEHSQSKEVPVTIPSEPDLRADVEGLKKWRDEFKKRAVA